MIIPGESSSSDDAVVSQTTGTVANFSSVHASSTFSSIVSLAGSKLRKQLQGKLNEHAAMPLTSNNSKAYQQLEKLGWKKGEAVGKRKIGITTHIRIEPRMTQAGVGAKSASTAEALQYDQHSGPEWWKHNVADTLAKLQEQNSSTKSSKKKKSKRSRSPQSIIIDEMKFEDVVNDNNNEQNQMSERDQKKLKKLQKKEKKEKRKKMKNCEMDADNDNSNELKDAPADKKHIFTDDELFAATGGVRFSMRAGKTRNLAKWKRTENYDVKSTTTESLKNKGLPEETSGNNQSKKSDNDKKGLNKRKRNNAVEEESKNGLIIEERRNEYKNDDQTNVVKSNEAEKNITEKKSQSLHETLVQIPNDDKKKKKEKRIKEKSKKQKKCV